MADRIVINFGAETRDVEAAGRRMEGVLSDTEGAIEDVGEAGQDSLAQVTKAQDEAADSARGMGDDIASNGGAFDDLASTADDALGGIGDGLLGVAGIAGGVGGAVSQLVGGAISGVTDIIKEQQDAAKQLHDDLVGAYVDAGKAGMTYLEQAVIINAAADIYADDGKRADFEKKAAAIGVTLQTYVLAQAGSYEDLKVVIEATGIAAETAGQIGADKSKAGQAEALKEKQAVDAIIVANERLLAAHEEGKTAAEDVVSTKETLAQRERDQIKRTRDAEAERFDALANKYAEAAAREPVDIQTKLTVDESALDRIKNSRYIVNVVAQVSDRYGRTIV